MNQMSVIRCVFLFLLGITSVFADKKDHGISMPEGTLLVIDTLNESSDFPSDFRFASDPFAVHNVLNHYKGNKNLPSREGLQDLGCSGSSQFSVSSFVNLRRLIKRPLIVVDLRLEPHGYLDGHSVSWFAPGNNFYGQNYTKEWAKTEYQFMNILNQKNKTKIHTIIDRYNKRILESSSFMLSYDRFLTEEQLLKSYDVRYIRLPVLDGELPQDRVVDMFLDLVQKVSKEAWLHIHCRGGVGRTTIFMILYDILKNSRQVSLDHIIERQYLLGPTSLDKFPEAKRIEIKKFLKSFYAYVQDTKGLGQAPWSEWVVQKNKLAA